MARSRARGQVARCLAARRAAALALAAAAAGGAQAQTPDGGAATSGSGTGAPVTSSPGVPAGSGAGIVGGSGLGLPAAITGFAANAFDAASAAAPVTKSLVTGVRSALTYSDNLLLARPGSEQGGFIAEVSPYARYTASGSSLRGSGYVSMRNFYRTEGDEISLGRFEANANFTAKLYEDFLWLDAGGRIANVSGTAFGAQSYDAAASGVNVTTVRTYFLSPYVRSRTPWFDYELRYRYNTSNLSGAFYGQTQQSAIASANTGTRLGRWSLGYIGDITQTTLGDGRKLERRSSTARLGYAINSELRVGVIGSYDQIDNLRGSSGRDDGFGYGGFVDWRPNTRFSLDAQATRRYYGTTSSVNAAWRTRRGTWTLTYLRSVLSSADASLLFYDPSSLGNPSAVPNSFNPASTFNPITALLYQQSLLLFGLTPLDLSVVSNALVLDKRLIASGGIVGVRNSLVGNLFYNTRESVGTFSQRLTSTGGNLGIGATFNGLLTQRGATLTFQHRLQSRTSVNVTGRRTMTRVDGTINGLTTPGETTLTQVIGSVSTRLTADSTASVGLRRSVQRQDSGGYNYTENAVFGTLDTRF